MARLVTLSQQRINRELDRVRLHDETERVWRRRVVAVWLLAAGWYALGLFLVALSLHLDNGYRAQIALWTGMVIGNGCTLGTLFAFWVKYAS